ncbi:conserved membrane hypothetical protein [Candidatus Sulfopaludibacter sp. SbA3]|nr:conserved membrane hypothetical protein [Candidatus Sulfopaludibacter sp. SbA3]
MFTESLSLSLAGGTAGVVLSFALIPVITALLPDLRGMRPDEVHVAVDGHVLLFALAASLASGVLCGLAPVAHCWRLNLAQALKDAPRTPGNHTAGAVRSFLVTAEVALCVVLLFAAIVTVRGFAAARERSLGFETIRVLKAGYSLPPKLYPGYSGRIVFARTLLARLQNLPGVQAAAIGSLGGPESLLSMPGLRQDVVRHVDVGFVSRDFAGALGIPLRAGRLFGALEVDGADRVGLVNERAALLWPHGASAVGSHIRLSLLQNPGRLFLLPEFRASADSAADINIVGIIADTKPDGELGIAHAPLVLVPYTLAAPSASRIFLRTAGHPMMLWDAVRREAAAIDPAQTIGNPWAVQGRLDWNEDRDEGRFEMALFGCVALAGLALAATGIYSVLSFTVARKTHEVGLRMALGATQRDVLSAVFVSGMRSVWIGLAAGIPICCVLAAQVDTGAVPKTDAWALAAILLLLIPPALLACYVPAKRAVRLDPSVALRHE